MTAQVRTQLSRDLVPRRRREVVLLAGHACRLDAACIGWLPWQFYEEVDASGRLVSVSRDGELVGFAAWRCNEVEQAAKIMQIWVRRDARQIEHGRALLSRVARESFAARCGLRRLSLWCAEDLLANEFWRGMGCTAEAWRLGRGVVVAPDRSRPIRRHLLWTSPLKGLVDGRGHALGADGGSAV